MIRQSKVTIREINTDFIPGTLVELGGVWRYSHTFGNYNYYVMNVSD